MQSLMEKLKGFFGIPGWFDDWSGVTVHTEEVPVDILVVDVSGSMAEPDYPPCRLAGAQHAAIRFCERRAQSGPDGMVGIIKYASKARVVASPVPVRCFEQLKASIATLSPMDATNIGAGLKTARQEFQRFARPRNPRIVLLTDGYSNVGPDPETAAARVKEDKIQLDIIGIGGSPADVNEPQLRRMASVVNGQRRYWFIKSADELVQKFEALALREFK
jgi:Mg-chelatase subunit ChlD